MKANEAPERIILSADKDSGILSDYWVVNDYTDNIKIEYVRTDAFIEKACVKLKKLMYDNLMFQGRLHREEIIENFVGEFRKYMKE